MNDCIRDARIEDLPRIVEIYNASIPLRRATADTHPVSVESRMKWFNDHDPKHYPLWVLEQDGEILAWIGLQPFRDKPAYHFTAEFSIYVDPSLQKEGIGTLLLKRMIGCCPHLGVTVLLGLIFANNEPSIRLVKKLGFRRWGYLYGVTEFDGIKRDVLIVGLRVKKQRVEPSFNSKPFQQA